MLDISSPTVAARLQGIERIDLSGPGDNVLTVSQRAVLGGVGAAGRAASMCWWSKPVPATGWCSSSRNGRRSGRSQMRTDGSTAGCSAMRRSMSSASRCRPNASSALEPQWQQRLQAERRGGRRLGRLHGRLGGRSERRRFADLIMGAISADPNGSRIRGELCRVRQGVGLRGEHRSLDAESARPASSSTAPRPGCRAGVPSPRRGDVNGDGFDDLIIGALIGRTGRQPCPGRATSCSARHRALPPISISSSLNGTTGFRLSGVAARRLDRLLGRFGGRRQRRRLRRSDRRRPLRRSPRRQLRRNLCRIRQGVGLRRRYRSRQPSNGSTGFRLSGAGAG